MNDSIIYALDFDGVICDSAVETAITGWKAAASIWPDMDQTPPPALIDRFREVRPIIETGYESILAMRLLHLGDSTADIFEHFGERVQSLLQQAQINTDRLKQLFGETRDQWIAADLEDWIAMNPLFPGVAEKLQSLAQHATWYVITTKQERFVKHILAAHGLSLADERIFGLDRNLSKPQVLKGLIAEHPPKSLAFVEDRLPTLQSVRQHPELADVQLIFALWGYNSTTDKAVANSQGFILQNLSDFLTNSPC